MGDHQLALAVLGGLDEHLDLVTDLEVRVVTELGGGDDTFALGADVHDDLALVDRGDDTVDHLVLDDALEGLGVEGGDFLAVLTGNDVVLQGIPVEILGGDGGVEGGLLGFFFLDRSLYLSFFCHILDFFRHSFCVWKLVV